MKPSIAAENSGAAAGLPGASPEPAGLTQLLAHLPVALSYALLDEVGGIGPTCFNHHAQALFAAAEGEFWLDQVAHRNFLVEATGARGEASCLAELRGADGGVCLARVAGRRLEMAGRAYLMVSYQDVTAQQQLDAARLESEAQLREFREMVQSANDAMLLVEDGLIIECNPAALKLYGAPRSGLIGKHPAELSPRTQRAGQSSLGQADALMALALAGTAQRFLWHHCRVDGTPFIADVALNPAMSLTLPGGVQRQRFVAVLRDVTEAEHAAQALKESELRFRQLFELAPVPLVLTTPEGRVSAVNRQWSSLLGYSVEDVPDLEHWWAQAYPDPALQARARASWAAGVAQLSAGGGEINAMEVQVRCKNGATRTLLVGGATVGKDILASLYDVTEQRVARAELEALNASLESRVEERTRALQQAIEHLRRAQDDLVRSEKLAGLGALVAGMAHELNTPIGNALMVACTLDDLGKRFGQAVNEGLRRSVLDKFLADWREATAVIERNLHRAAELIGSFKQVAVDQSSYQRRPFELAEVLHELRLTLSPSLRRQHVELVDDVSGELRMDSYPGPLTQVLMNVVNNAVVHAFEGRGAGRVEITGRPVDGDWVAIAVRDDGCGMEPANLAKAFDPFFTTKLGRGGSGLGLHIVYSLVTELLGGRVRIDSAPGAGCTVTIQLPRVAPQPTPANA